VGVPVGPAAARARWNTWPTCCSPAKPTPFSPRVFFHFGTFTVGDVKEFLAEKKNSGQTLTNMPYSNVNSSNALLSFKTKNKAITFRITRGEFMFYLNEAKNKFDVAYMAYRVEP